jgi:ATP phosphoribosyltransferase
MSQLILAVPSKGRLEENAADIFARAGMPLKRAGARGYQGRLSGMDTVDVLYLSASEIAARLREGSIHFGITGEDLLREEIPDLDSAIQLVQPLGFGHADVVVALPDGWVDVTCMADLAEVAGAFRAEHNKRLRVATKYTHLTAEYFARHGVVDYVLVQSFGATEGAPASGAAEAIVDITSTGATLAANNLRVPEDGVILKSQANLAAALKADWSPEARGAAKQILARLSAYQQAMERLVVSFIVDTKDAALFDGFGLDGSRRMAGQDETYFDLVIEKSALQLVQDILSPKQIGMTVSKPDFVFSPRNELFERLAGAIL